MRGGEPVRWRWKSAGGVIGVCHALILAPRRFRCTFEFDRSSRRTLSMKTPVTPVPRDLTRGRSQEIAGTYTFGDAPSGGQCVRVPVYTHAGMKFQVFSTTDLSAPLTIWALLGSAAEVAASGYSQIPCSNEPR
jgi:hypothetical protein